MNYERKPTTSKVWKAIKEAHDNDLIVFSSYSAPDGDMYGSPYKCVMMTQYGFRGAEYPFMGAKITWNRPNKFAPERENKVCEYWLCLPERESK